MQFALQADTIIRPKYLQFNPDFQIKMTMKRSQIKFRLLNGFVSAAGLFLSSVSIALAQADEPKSGLVQQSQTSVFEYILVAALFGLALYAICRTSHRS